MKTLPRLLLATLLCAVAGEAVPAPRDDIEQTVRDFLAAQTQGLGTRVDIEVGKVLTTNRHEGCRQWKAFLPAGARVWGRVTVGVRCEAGINASLYVGARVRAYGNYLVVANPIQGGQTIENGDLKLASGELTVFPPDLLLQPQDAVGHVARQALSPRQPLRASYLRQPAAVQAGESVQIVSQGEGFAVSYGGQALNTASAGQLVRVRLPNGRIVSGVAREGGTVEIATQ